MWFLAVALFFYFKIWLFSLFVVISFCSGIFGSKTSDASEKLQSGLFEMNYSSRLVMHVCIVRFVCWRCVHFRTALCYEKCLMANLKSRPKKKRIQNICVPHSNTHTIYSRRHEILELEWKSRMHCMCIKSIEYYGKCYDTNGIPQRIDRMSALKEWHIDFIMNVKCSRSLKFSSVQNLNDLHITRNFMVMQMHTQTHAHIHSLQLRLTIMPTKRQASIINNSNFHARFLTLAYLAIHHNSEIVATKLLSVA